jgi:hypothetical protein
MMPFSATSASIVEPSLGVDGRRIRSTGGSRLFNRQRTCDAFGNTKGNRIDSLFSASGRPQSLRG